MIAWRYWGLASLTQPILISPKWGQGWTPREIFRATCLATRPCPLPPTEGCDCGIHAYRELGQIRAEMGRLHSGYRFNVVGKVQLSGDVIEGDDLRAAAAYPVSLVFLDKTWLLPVAVSGVVDALADRYLVPADAMNWEEIFSLDLRPGEVPPG